MGGPASHRLVEANTHTRPKTVHTHHETFIHNTTVFLIYRYHTAIDPKLDSFWSGMVLWYGKVVCEILIL